MPQNNTAICVATKTPAPLASRRDAECRRLDPPVVFAALDHRLMAFILSGYEIKDAFGLARIRKTRNSFWTVP